MSDRTPREQFVQDHKRLLNAVPFLTKDLAGIRKLAEYSWAKGRICEGDMLLVIDAGMAEINSTLSGFGYLIPKQEIGREVSDDGMRDTFSCRVVPLRMSCPPEGLQSLEILCTIDKDVAEQLASGAWAEIDQLCEAGPEAVAA